MRHTPLLKKKQGASCGAYRECHAASPRRALSGVGQGSHEETALAEFERHDVAEWPAQPNRWVAKNRLLEAESTFAFRKPEFVLYLFLGG
jgi:hypothetical protein